MPKVTVNVRFLLVLSAILLAAAYIVGQEPIPDYRPTTIAVHNLAFRPDGSPDRSEVSTYTFRADGSMAQEWTITKLDTGQATRGRAVRDFATRLATLMMPDLGVSVTREIPENAIRSEYGFTRSCRSRVEQVGIQVGDDPLHRRELGADGQVTVKRYVPELGCKVFEFTVYLADGRIANSQEIIRSVPSADESLFRPDATLKAVTWSDLARAHASRYEGSINEKMEEGMRKLDAENPPILGK